MLNATKQLNLSLHSTLEKGFETSTTVFYKFFYQVATLIFANMLGLLVLDVQIQNFLLSYML